MNDDGDIAALNKPNICALLGTHDNGATAEELSKVLGDAVATLEELALDGQRKSKATLTIKLTFDRDEGVYRVGVEHTVKVPGPRATREIMYATTQHGLVRENPRQQRMDFGGTPDRRLHIPS